MSYRTQCVSLTRDSEVPYPPYESRMSHDLVCTNVKDCVCMLCVWWGVVRYYVTLTVMNVVGVVGVLLCVTCVSWV